MVFKTSVFICILRKNLIIKQYQVRQIESVTMVKDKKTFNMFFYLFNKYSKDYQFFPVKEQKQSLQKYLKHN